MTDAAERTTVLDFVVPGRPIPKGRPRVANGHAYTPERTKAHEELIAGYAAIAMARQHYEQPFDEPLGVRLTFAMPDAHRIDIDNAIKCPLDAGNAIVWVDDSLIEEIAARRIVRRGVEGWTRVEVWTGPNPEEHR